MTTDNKQIERSLKTINEIWSKVRPGARVCGLDNEGNACVFPCEELTAVLGHFDSEAEARAYAAAPQHIEALVELVKKLMREREEVRTALKEICQVADPAYDAFNEQKPVDMAAVLRVTHHWGHHILG